MLLQGVAAGEESKGGEQHGEVVVPGEAAGVYEDRVGEEEDGGSGGDGDSGVWVVRCGGEWDVEQGGDEEGGAECGEEACCEEGIVGELEESGVGKGEVGHLQVGVVYVWKETFVGEQVAR